MYKETIRTACYIGLLENLIYYERLFFYVVAQLCGCAV